MKCPAYPKYKDSGVQWLGQVPEHWEVKRLSYLALLKSGESITSEQIAEGGDYPVYGGNGLRGNYLAYTHEGSFVLIGRQGALCGNINYATGRFWASEHAVVVNPLEAIATRWLGELLYSMNLNQYSVSAAQPGLSVSQIGSLKIPVPPLPEQTAIADFLDWETGRIDTLVAKKRRLIALLGEKRTALISRTVTRGLPAEAAREFGLEPHTRFKSSGIEWLGEVPEEWETPPLYSRYSIELGKMLNESRITGEHLVRYLRNVDVQWDLINYEDLPEMDIPEAEHSRYTIQTGDLLVCEGGEVGRAAIVGVLSSTTGFQKALHRIRARKPTEIPRYMYYILYWASKVGVFNAGGISTIAHLTGEQLRKYRFPAPPHPEQTAIAAYLDRETTTIDQLVAKVEAAIVRLLEYRTALITAAVTGKIDVREKVDKQGPTRTDTA